MRSFLEYFETEVNGICEYLNCIIVNDRETNWEFPLPPLYFDIFQDRDRWNGFSHHIAFYVSMLWPSFMKTDWFLKHSGKILKLGAREKQEHITTHYCAIGSEEAYVENQMDTNWKKFARTSSEGFNSGEITSALVASDVDSKLPSLFNLSVSLPHALRRPFIQPRLGWILCYLPGKELFFCSSLSYSFWEKD